MQSKLFFSVLNEHFITVWYLALAYFDLTLLYYISSTAKLQNPILFSNTGLHKN